MLSLLGFSLGLELRIYHLHKLKLAPTDNRHAIRITYYIRLNQDYEFK